MHAGNGKAQTKRLLRNELRHIFAQSRNLSLFVLGESGVRLPLETLGIKFCHEKTIIRGAHLRKGQVRVHAKMVDLSDWSVFWPPAEPSHFSPCCS
jgi:hypothetical protein